MKGIMRNILQSAVIQYKNVKQSCHQVKVNIEYLNLSIFDNTDGTMQ